jgi:arylsulfatase A-like enzyme
MTHPPGGERSARASFRAWLGAHTIVAAGVFVLGATLFVLYSASLTNRFAAIVREQHLGAVARANLALLPIYLAIAFYHAALSYPIAARLRGAQSFGWRLVHATWTMLLVFLLSLGPLTYVTTGPLDTLARTIAAAFPRIDLYYFLDARVREVFTAAHAALAIFAVRELYLRVERPFLAWPRFPRRLALVGIGIAALLPFTPDLVPAREAAGRNRTRPHVIVIASDSLRADHLGFHGYSRNVSPHLDRLAKESVDFRNAHVATASTIESWTSFLTGRYPANHGIRYMFVTREQADRIASDPATLPRRFATLGYRTAVFGDWAANCFDVLDFGFDRRAVSSTQNLDVFLSEIAFRVHPLVPFYCTAGPFHSVVPNLRQATAVLAPDRIVDEFVAEIRAADAAGQPTFSVLFLSCTHLPFLAPYPFNRRFVDPDYRGPNRFRIDFDVDEFMRRGFADAQSEAERQHVIDLYDGGVAWFDSIVGGVVDRLRGDGILDDAIFVVTSDHGEDLYEPGTTLGHGTNFFGGDQATRIPLLVRFPRAEHGGRTVDAIVRGIDLNATLLDLADPGARHDGGDGVSLRPLIEGAVATLDLPAFAETCYLFFQKQPIVDGDNSSEVLRPADETLRIDPEFRGQFVLEDRWHDAVIRTKDRMLRTERWKLIRVEGTRGPIWRLYDMSSDPSQQHDRSREGLAVFDRMRMTLDEWTATGRDARWPASLDRE